MYKYENFLSAITSNKLIPVVTIETAENVIPLTKTLINNGIKIIEITLRTEEGINAIRLLKEAKMDIKIGAGTVYNTDQFKILESIGVDFIVSPGTTDDILGYAAISKTPYMPGVMTASDILKAVNYGFKILKFFPAGIAGGVKAIQTYQWVYQDVLFCPTGSVNTDNCLEYLSLPNVCGVGGTWIASKEDINNKKWDEIAKKITKAKNILSNK